MDRLQFPLDNSNQYPFLTPEVQQAIISAVHHVMTENNNLASTSKVYKDFKPKNQSAMTRAFLETCLKQVFVSMPNVEVCYIRNTFVIIFDGEYFMYLRKSVDSDACFADPKVLHNLQVRFYDEEFSVDMPLPGMEHLVAFPITGVNIMSALYICDGATQIVGFYINQQKNGVLTGSEEITLGSTSIPFSATHEDESGLDFTFKTDNDADSKGDQASRSRDDGSVG